MVGPGTLGARAVQSEMLLELPRTDPGVLMNHSSHLLSVSLLATLFAVAGPAQRRLGMPTVVESC